MLVLVDANSGVPVYRQIVDQIRFHIGSGLLGAGDILPSTRSLSQELGVNPMTVSKAYAILEEEGMLEHRPGRPLIVARLDARTVEQERMTRFRSLLEPIVLAAEQLGIPTPQAVSALREMLQDAREPRSQRKHA